MSYGLIIFDCDGVLVDSEPPANRVFTEALNGIGLDMAFDEVCDTFIGLSMPRCLEIVESRLGGPAPARFLERLQERTFEAFRRELAPVRGVADMLARIDDPVCVASSGEREKMELTLGLTGLLPRFAGRLFSSTEVPRGKPAPDLFLHAARNMGVEPAGCAVVEDTPIGARAGRAAGMRVFGYAERSDGRALAAEGATVFDDMTRLPELLDGGAS